MIVCGKAKVLLVEDDGDLRRALPVYLTKAGYEVTTAADGLNGLHRLYVEQPSIVLLALTIPKMEAWDVCRRIRDLANTPVIILEDHADEAHRTRGSTLGVEDYLTKPFGLGELKASISAALQRRKIDLPKSCRSVYSCGDLIIDLSSHEVLKNWRRVDLTPMELGLLVALAENAGQILSARQLMTRLRGPGSEDSDASAKVLIWRLRQRIESNPKKPEYILTERGVGYRLARGRGDEVWRH